MPRSAFLGFLLAIAVVAAAPAGAGEPCVAPRDASAGAFATPQPCAPKKKPVVAPGAAKVDPVTGASRYQWGDTSVSVGGYVRSDTVVGKTDGRIREH